MQEVFDEDQRQPAERRRDTELTMGPMMLLGFFMGLVVLCGLCFGLGYAMGSHNSHESSFTSQQTGGDASSGTAGSQAKPPAAPQSNPQQQSASAAPSSANGTNDDEAADSQNAGSTPAAGGNSVQPVVKPALPAAAAAPASAGMLMVQIATLSHQEDADVLVGALRRRGFAVTARRDPADGQFHVRIGPFASRSDANATRQKLLSDGYNAVVQP
jgi:cell division septation protein DedD